MPAPTKMGAKRKISHFQVSLEGENEEKTVFRPQTKLINEMKYASVSVPLNIRFFAAKSEIIPPPFPSLFFQGDEGLRSVRKVPLNFPILPFFFFFFFIAIFALWVKTMLLGSN